MRLKTLLIRRIYDADDYDYQSKVWLRENTFVMHKKKIKHLESVSFHPNISSLQDERAFVKFLIEEYGCGETSVATFSVLLAPTRWMRKKGMRSFWYGTIDLHRNRWIRTKGIMSDYLKVEQPGAWHVIDQDYLAHIPSTKE